MMSLAETMSPPDGQPRTSIGSTRPHPSPHTDSAATTTITRLITASCTRSEQAEALALKRARAAGVEHLVDVRGVEAVDQRVHPARELELHLVAMERHDAEEVQRAVFELEHLGAVGQRERRCDQRAAQLGAGRVRLRRVAVR